MACNECNQVEECNDSSNPQCSCPLKLGTICVIYDGIELLTLNVQQGDNLQEILIKIDSLLTNLINGGLFTNIGNGEGVYKQVNLAGQAEFKTFVASDSVTVVVEGTEELKAEVDEAWLTTFIENIINNNATTLDNVGTGAELFKGLNVNVNEIRTLVSDSIDITQNTDTISLEVASFDNLQRYIVNNLYTGTEELGTIAKPFKTIQGALDAFVGTGSADNPQFDFATIVIQKGNTYSFSGNFSYRNLNVIIEEDVLISHSPSPGDWLVDYDALTEISAELNIEIKQGARVALTEKGIRNRGSLGGASEAKVIKLTGQGELSLSGSRQAGFTLIDLNSADLDGYSMPTRQNLVVTDVRLETAEKDIWNVGRGSNLIISNSIIRHSDVGATIDLASESFDQTGGSIILNSCDLFIIGVQRTNAFTLSKDPAFSCSLTLNSCKLTFPGITDNFFVNKSNPDLPTLNCRFFSMTNSSTINELFDSPVLWTTVNFEFNSFFSGNIDNAKVDLTKGNTVSTTNIISGQNIASLQTFVDRTTAAASLSQGALFVNTNSGGASSTHFIDMVI